MMPKRKSVIQQVMVLLTVLVTLYSWPAVSGSLTGSAEKLVDERLQTESLFKTAESTPPLINTPKANETSPLTSCGSKLYQRLILQGLEINQAVKEGYSFNVACQLHDVCYRDCITDRAVCDEELLANAEVNCEKAQNKAKCFVWANIFFLAVTVKGEAPFEEARANCSVTPNYSGLITANSIADIKYSSATGNTHPLDDTFIKSMIINRLKDYIPIDLIGNYMSGTNGVVEAIEILEKSYEKEQLNAIGKVFLGESKNYWGVVVRVKGHGQVGFNSMVAGMMSGDPNSKRSFNSITKYRFYDAGGGSWSLVSPEELRP